LLNPILNIGLGIFQQQNERVVFQVFQRSRNRGAAFIKLQSSCQHAQSAACQVANLPRGNIGCVHQIRAQPQSVGMGGQELQLDPALLKRAQHRRAHLLHLGAGGRLIFLYNEHRVTAFQRIERVFQGDGRRGVFKFDWPGFWHEHNHSGQHEQQKRTQDEAIPAF